MNVVWKNPSNFPTINFDYSHYVKWRETYDFYLKEMFEIFLNQLKEIKHEIQDIPSTYDDFCSFLYDNSGKHISDYV